MALVKFGAGIVSMSGKIAGSVFSRNRYGAICRQWSKPVNPNTPSQGLIRSVMGQIQNAWRNDLTADQRAAWQQYADNVQVQNRLGETMNLSGFNMFARSNAAALYNDLPLVGDGPTQFSLPETDSTIAVTPSEATQNLSLAFDTNADWVSEDGAALLVFCGAPQNSTVNFFNGPWKLAGKVEGDSGTPPTSPQAIACPYEIAAGQKLWIRCRILRADGRLSGFFRASAAVGA